jgi:hypothetical protein
MSTTMKKSFLDIASTIIPKSKENNKVGPGWKVIRQVNRDFSKKTEPQYTEDELYDMKLEEDYYLSLELEDVLYDIYLRREKESIDYFNLTGEYDTFAIEKDKYNEFKESEYYE